MREIVVCYLACQLENDLDLRFLWVQYCSLGADASIREDLGQIATEIKIALPVPHNTSTIVEEYVQ
jgi:hypothetical protein